MKPFDERLYVLKLQEASTRMQAETEIRRRQVRAEQTSIGQGFGGSYLAKLAGSDISVLGEYLKDVDKLSREVWQSDGNSITPEFIRTVLVRNVLTAIAARKGSIQHNLELLVGRMRIGSTDLQAALGSLAREIGHLQNTITTRYEIEAIELAKQREQVRYAAPPPIRPVRSFGIAHSASKPAQIPPDCPPYYPNQLKPKTQVIFAEAVRKFAEQTQALELCKYVISEMTPVFCAAVEARTMRRDQVLSDSGMGGLLHSLLVYNCDYDNERFRIGQELRKSDEWLNLVKAINEAEPDDCVEASLPEVWTKLERRGDFIVLAEPSNHTATQIRDDYNLLKWNLRQFDQWVSQQRENEKPPTIQDAKAAFGGTILIGDKARVPYLTDQELQDLIAHRQTPSKFAEGILIKRWGFTASTVRTYLRRRHLRKSRRR